MATIIINFKSYRDACLYGCDDAGIGAFDDGFVETIQRIRANAEKWGHRMLVDYNSTSGHSYCVEVGEEADEYEWHLNENAHDFMQSSDAGFWDNF